MPQPVAPTGPAAVLAAARSTNAGGLRGRRLLGVLLLAWLPFAIQLLVLALRDDSPLTGFNSFVQLGCRITVQTVAPVILAFVGTGAFADEWALGTSHFLVGAPLSRTALVLGRWLTVVRTGLLIVLPPLVASFFLNLASFLSVATLAEYLPALGWVLLATTLLVASLGALFLLAGLLLRRPLMVALVYVFVFEMAGGFLPPSLAVLSLNAHVRKLLWLLTGHDGFLAGPLEDLWKAQGGTLAAPLAWVLATGAAALALAVWRLRRKESGLSSSAAGDDAES